ncbi:MAG: hypothetical protein AAF193_01440, partial [Bacteroidota bacterium]
MAMVFYLPSFAQSEYDQFLEIKEKIHSANTPEEHFYATMELCNEHVASLGFGMDNLPPFAQENADKAIAWGKEFGNNEQIALARDLEFTIAFHKNNNLYEKYLLANLAHEYVEYLPSLRRDFYYQRMVKMHLHNARYQDLLDITQEMYSFRFEVGMPMDSAKYYGDLGIMYMDLNNFHQSLSNFQNSARVF